MAAGHAKTQVHPLGADAKTIFATPGAWYDLSDLIEMWTVLVHLNTPSIFAIVSPALNALPNARAEAMRLLRGTQNKEIGDCLREMNFCLRVTVKGNSDPAGFTRWS